MVPGIDNEFYQLMENVFGGSFMKKFKLERPAAHNELILGFETRKRSATVNRTTSYNMFLPFAFIDFFRTVTGSEVRIYFYCPFILMYGCFI